MNLSASVLVAASAAIMMLLGLLHLVYTFRGTKLHPRDDALKARMAEVSPMLTGETTMWKCWLGFNASHSLGAILFGTVYGWLALAEGAFFFGSRFLPVVGLVFLGSYAVLGKAYWFSVPFRGIVAAIALYVCALMVAWI